jgi:hypothetical protein
MNNRACSSEAWAMSFSVTSKPARAKTIAQPAPIDPEPMIEIFSGLAKHLVMIRLLLAAFPYRQTILRE